MGPHVPHLVIALSYFFQGKLAQAREPAEEAFRIAPWEPLVAGIPRPAFWCKPAEKDRVEEAAHSTPRDDPNRQDHVSPGLLGDRFRESILYERGIEERQPTAADGFLSRIPQTLALQSTLAQS